MDISWSALLGSVRLAIKQGHGIEHKLVRVAVMLIGRDKR